MKRRLGLDASREFRRSQRYKECKARGSHLHSGKLDFEHRTGCSLYQANP